jgi:signal recognition particle receptor subunit beta
VAFVHQRDRQIHFKIVYAGSARGGKTTNLLYLFSQLPPEKRGRLMSLAGAEERTLFFDFMAFHLGEVGGMDTRFHLYTVPGQPRHKRSRRAVLRGADVIVFVADSTPGHEEEVAAAWRELDEPGFLSNSGAGPARILQFNKRDLPEAVSVDDLRARLYYPAVQEVEASALKGRGVYESLRLACRAALTRYVSADGEEAGRSKEESREKSRSAESPASPNGASRPEPVAVRPEPAAAPAAVAPKLIPALNPREDAAEDPVPALIPALPEMERLPVRG